MLPSTWDPGRAETTHATYMFYSMSHAGHAIFVTKIANIDIECSASFVRFGIVNKQSLKVVWKTHNAVITIVQ
jgi:hypothetical protein